jgi:DtxR family Mn-dependent transcriptional regulator
MTASPTMQRYAAEIYRLQQDHEQVSLSALREHVDASHQAISRMMKRLEEGGYLRHELYQGVRLTERGEHIAMPALRRHRLSEVFLVKVMGYDWAQAHELTDSFELGVNDELEDRMDELTGSPTRCPHGEPIPSKDGVIVFPDDVCLAELGSGIKGSISRVRTHDFDKLTYIAKLGLVPGREFSLLSCAPFQGPLRLELDNRDDFVIGYELAKVIWVEVDTS